MEQIKAHIAVSLDGHTATPDYELDWMPREVKELAAREHAAASCLLMGANTYNYIFEHWGGWPHKSKRSFVVSHYDTNVTPDCGVEFLTEEPLQRVYELKQETDMLVVGGGKLLTSLIKAGLLDSLTIYTVPVMAGKGIGFVGETSGSLWKLSESRVLDNGVVCSTYLFGGDIKNAPGFPPGATTKISIIISCKTYHNEISAAKIGYFFGFAFFSGNEKPTLNCSSSTSEASKALPFLPLKPLISPVLCFVTSSTICLSESCLSHLLRNMVSVQSTLEHFATFG